MACKVGTSPELALADAFRIRCQLAEYVLEATEKFTARLRKAELDFDEDRWRDDVHSALAEYLSEEIDQRVSRGEYERRQMLRILADLNRLKRLEAPATFPNLGLEEVMRQDDEARSAGLYREFEGT